MNDDLFMMLAQTETDGGAPGAGSGGSGFAAYAPALKAELVEHTTMRKVIAKRLTEAKQSVPHFYLTVDVQMDGLMAARQTLNDMAPLGEDDKPAYKLTVNDMILKASALALRDYPNANASWTDAGLQKHGSVDVAVAVAIDGGLITPIVRHAEQKPMIEISAEMKQLASLARAGKLMPEQYQGGTFSLSNLGMFGIKHFDAIINPPQAAILACGATEYRPVADTDGNLAVAQVMTLTLSVDHRVIDGALGAELLGRIKFYLENPIAILA